MKSILRKVTLAALLLVVLASASCACTVVMAGKKATVNGEVLVSYTCDGWYDNRLTVIPAKKYPKGAMAPVYKIGRASCRERV